MIYLRLFWIFFKIGLFTFGGGYAMIPMMKDDLIGENWLTMEELTNFMAISESTPGPFAVNVATFTGFKEAGILGGIVATLGVILPSIIIILLIAKIFTNFSKNKYVKNVLKGIRPVVVGLISAVGISLIYSAILPGGFNDISSFMWQPIVIIAVSAFLKFRVKKLNPIFIILIAAVLGMVLYSL